MHVVSTIPSPDDMTWSSDERMRIGTILCNIADTLHDLQRNIRYLVNLKRRGYDDINNKYAAACYLQSIDIDDDYHLYERYFTLNETCDKTVTLYSERLYRRYHMLQVATEMLKVLPTTVPDLRHLVLCTLRVNDTYSIMNSSMLFDKFLQILSSCSGSIPAYCKSVITFSLFVQYHEMYIRATLRMPTTYKNAPEILY